MAVIKETDSQPKDGKNYESIEHEGRKAVLQKVVGGIHDADDECKELKDDEMKLSVIVRTSGGKIVTDAVIPEALHNQVPEIIAKMAVLMDRTVREKVRDASAYERGFKAGQEAAKKQTVSENGEEV